MVKREREGSGKSLAKPDRSGLWWIDQHLLVEPRLAFADPDLLMKNNPAGLIVNRVTYEDMRAHFARELFEQNPPEVAWVEVYTYQGVKEIELMVDGLTRTGFAQEYKHKGLAGLPEGYFDRIHTFNSTVDILQNKRFVPEEEHRPGQRALTVQQYLRKVVTETVGHAEIAPHRIAAHLTNAWIGRVGPDLADKFPAVAVFSFLADRIGKATDNELQRTLDKQGQMVVNEAPEERQRLNKAIRETAAIIRQAMILKSGLTWDDVEQAAYFLVGSGDDIIGGKDETKRQILAMLNSVGFEYKLTKEYPTESSRTQAAIIRMECARALEEAFQKFAGGSPDSERALKDAKRAIDDRLLNINQTLRIITAQEPDREYIKVIKEIKTQVLFEQFQLASKRRTTFTEDETTLLINATNNSNLSVAEAPKVVNDIQFVVVILRQSREWQRQAESEMDENVRSGANAATITQAIADVAQRQQAILTTTDTWSLGNRANNLQKAITQFKQAVHQEIVEHNINQSVVRIFNQELSATQDLYLQAKLFNAVLHAKNLNRDNIADVNKWLKDLRGLDFDIQADVMNGEPIETALRRHRERRMIRPQAAERPTVTPAQETTVVPVLPSREKPQPSISQEEINRRRIERNVQKLKEVIEEQLLPGSRIIETLDLSPQEVPAYLKKLLGDAEIPQERLRSGHPNVVRVMDIDYDRLLKEVTRLNSIIVQMQKHQSDNETRLPRG